LPDSAPGQLLLYLVTGKGLIAVNQAGELPEPAFSNLKRGGKNTKGLQQRSNQEIKINRDLLFKYISITMLNP
jgi:hypothetical protein